MCLRSKISVSTILHSTNFSRYDFDAAPSTSGSNDPIATLWSISEWLRHIGTYPVSRFILLHWIDLYRFDFQSSASTAVLPLHPAFNGRITNLSVLLSRSPLRLQCVNAFKVSVLNLQCLTDVYRSIFESSASMPESNDSISTLLSVSKWPCNASTYLVGCSNFLHIFVIDMLDLWPCRFDLDLTTSTDESNDSIQTFGQGFGWLRNVHAS